LATDAAGFEQARVSGPAAQRRDACLARLPERLAWTHGYDALGR